MQLPITFSLQQIFCTR